MSSTIASQSSSSGADIQSMIDHVEEHGYVIIPNAFTEAELEEAHTELLRLAADAASAGPAGGDRAGRNDFEGLNTKRIYALLNKSPVFQKFPIQTTLLALNDHFLDSGYLLNSFHSVYIQPGEAPQMLHHDDGFVTLPRPHRPFGTGVMVAIDDFTATNGATVVIPGSHKWGDKNDQAPRREDTIPVIMPRGSAVFFVGTLWHGGGQNTFDKERRSMTIQYCQPWIRPLENQILAVEWEKLEGMPRKLVDMLGYGVGAPFIGRPPSPFHPTLNTSLLHQNNHLAATHKRASRFIMDDPKDPLHEQLQRLLTAVTQAEAQPEYFNTARGLADLRRFVEAALSKSTILRQQEADLARDRQAHDDSVDSVLKKVKMAVEATGVRDAVTAMKQSMGNPNETNKPVATLSVEGRAALVRDDSTNLNDILPGIVEGAVTRAFQNSAEAITKSSQEGKTVVTELTTKLESLVESKQRLESKSTQLLGELESMRADRDRWQEQASLKEATLAQEKKSRERIEIELEATKKDIITSSVNHSSAKDQPRKRLRTSSSTADNQLRQQQPSSVTVKERMVLNNQDERRIPAGFADLLGNLSNNLAGFNVVQRGVGSLMHTTTLKHIGPLLWKCNAYPQLKDFLEHTRPGLTYCFSAAMNVGFGPQVPPIKSPMDCDHHVNKKYCLLVVCRSETGNQSGKSFTFMDRSNSLKK
ncbi:hypothetical protein CkaCkLH20_09454 [Colletotrichum karsti]|uniref:Phytanoyl-CoA dioxygenase n=1 Tax=Colletotrichum karsti TaxID=1095194 RepID=A0A9P6HYK2_9PEZI|nr:uncharacterized protein CkaCkLH20_09454 [Colletotrichum karsti]KAF9872944.1 hypothetical protein CkaCkLH20_09454 [Colletotrichum karsti]